MQINIDSTKEKISKSASNEALQILEKNISDKGYVSIVLATGASQMELLKAMVSSNTVDWSKVNMFHLDEYIGLPETHPASFRKYLEDRFISKIPGLKSKHLINGNVQDPKEECKRLNKIISQYPIDLAFVGIGENGHLAFNDPPADFETKDPYIGVELDEICRRQQMGEGWFNALDDVPMGAISMSIQQVMKAKNIICTVPGKRKADAVKNCLAEEITNMHPASILKKHSNCSIYLDKQSASLLKNM